MQKNERHWPRGSAITVAISVDGEPPENGLRARVEEMRFGPDGVATHVQLTMRSSEVARLVGDRPKSESGDLARAVTELVELLHVERPRLFFTYRKRFAKIRMALQEMGVDLSWSAYEDMESSGEPPEEQA